MSAVIFCLFAVFQIVKGLVTSPVGFGNGVSGAAPNNPPQPCTNANIKLIHSHAEARDGDTEFMAAEYHTWIFSEPCSFVVYMKYLSDKGSEHNWIYWGGDVTNKYIYFSRPTSGFTVYGVDTTATYNYPLYDHDSLISTSYRDGCYIDNNVIYNDCWVFFSSGLKKTYFIVHNIYLFQFNSDYDFGKMGFYTIPFSEYMADPTRPRMMNWANLIETYRMLNILKKMMLYKLVLGTMSFENECPTSFCTVTQTQYEKTITDLVDGVYQHMITG